MSKTGKALWKLLDDVDQWEVTRYTILHKNTGHEFCMANGGFFFQGYDGTPKTIGLIERHFLFRKARRIADIRLARALRGAQQEAQP
ncbi:hypothetical protein [Xenophilus sp. Marseille-Q4582]|uniref:hypothetical protein n=1 Tax=Xenophilus sp. Marseille-Q4582 TaxID=2866600 RepID=UPI001CE46A41|nr:hypothetical protein [Xenophilus sp. Marseille-Q4582]